MKPSSSSRPAPRPAFSLRRFVPAALALAPIAVLPPGHALPTGAQVAAGTVAVAQAGGAMTLTQSSRNAIVNWQSFGLGAGESLRLAQPGADAALLARVTGGEASQLLGSLHADGKLFLINPKGIVVGRGAVIDTAGFVASTHDTGDADFLRGTDLVFRGDSAAGIVNLGTIRAREGGLFLFAHTVNNAGTLAAEKGTAGLGAGTEFHLVSADAPTFTVRLNLASAAAKTGVDNAGVVAAARAQLEAAGGSVYELAVNQSGVVRATGVENKNGRVLLTAAGGTVGVSGQVVARNADGSGGEILVGGDFQGKNAAVANAARTVVTADAKLDASAATGAAKAGRVIVWADDATRFLGTLEADGAGGGFAEVSGKLWLDFDPAAPARLGAGGTLLLDPDALVVSTAASSGTGASGANPFVFGATTTPATLNVATLQNQLALTNVTLDTSTSGGDISVNTAVTWSTGNTLRLQAGGNINLNANIAGGTGSVLALYAGRAATAPSESGLSDINGDATLLSGSTVTVGTLTFGANAAAAPTGGYTLESPARGGRLVAYGDLNVGTLRIDLAGGRVGVSTEGANNAIGAFGTTGTGPLSSTYVVDHQGGLDVTLNSTAADGVLLQFITPGALTLKSGSSVNFPSSGTVVLASRGGAFVNQAGASVFGANARYLIYTSTAAATTRGGLAPTYVFNTAFDINSSPSPYTEDSISRIIYTGSRPTLTLAADNRARSYGDANPVFAVSGTGLVDGDTLQTAVTGAAALSTAATASSGVGSYAITAAAGTLASSFYALAFAPGTLTVNKAPLTVSVSTAMTKNQGDANPNFATFTTATGLKLSDTLATAVPDLAFTTAATTASPAGAYAVNAGGTSANYALTFSAGLLTVSAAELPLLTYAAGHLTRTYGAANPALTFSRSGLVSGVADDVTGAPALSTAATQASGVGTYSIAIAQGTLASSNYRFAFTPGTLTVNRAPLTITANNATRTYGAANPVFGATYAGLVNGDTSAAVSGLSLATTATAASGVGSYAITPAGGAAANYSLSYVPGTLTVDRAPLTITANNATRTYGAANPVFGATYAGLVNGDTSAVVSGLSLATTATTASGVGSYAITPAGGVAANYALNYVPGRLTIGGGVLTFAANNAVRTYGAANPTFGYRVTGFLGGDTAATAFTGAPALSTTATQSSGVGSYAIAIGQGTLAAANYDLAFTPGTLTVDRAPLTITANNATRTYGAANPVFGATYAGLVNGDTPAAVSGLSLATTATAASGVGSYAITASGGAAANYSLSYVPGTLTVDRAPLTAFIAPAVRGFGGANAPFFFGNIDGLVNGETDAVLSGVSFATLAGIAAVPGVYPITGSATAANYAVTVVPGRLTVTRAPFFVQALSTTGTVGSVAAGYPVFGAPVPVAGGPQFTVAAAASATNSSPAGAYALTPVITRTDGLPSALLDLYYDVRLAPGTLTLRNPPIPTVLDGLQPTQLGSPVPITLNTGTNTINRDVTIVPDQQVEVARPQSVSLGIVMQDTRPLTRAEYAGYFGTFSGTTGEVRAALKVGYDKFLQGYGKSGTAYSAMSPEGRALLARWMAGGITDAAFQAMIAAGVAGANEAFGFMLPTLVEKTRAKDAAQMTGLDRQILGRLADLTEKQRADTVRIAQEKYQKMLADQATMASTGTLNVILRGPGDFKEIVQSARQEALSAAIGVAAGSGAIATAAGTIALQLVPVLNAIFIHEGSTAAAIGGAGAVPAIIIFFVTTLASRSIQINESLKNEQAFHDFIGSFRDEQITSIAQLKSPAMSEELKLSTLLLSAEFLATSRP